jgi:hypothetical protein
LKEEGIRGGGRGSRNGRRKRVKEEGEDKPASSYSYLLIHSCWKVERMERKEA